MLNSIHLVHSGADDIIRRFGISPSGLTQPLSQLDSVQAAAMQQLNILKRDAARGIIQQQDNILLMYTERYDDFSLPGGGVDAHEAPLSALKRELREEAGAGQVRVLRKFAQVTEYLPTWKLNWDLMYQTSHCYECELQGELMDNRLEQYEVANGMSVRWVKLDEALRHNRAVIAAKPRNIGVSIYRETRILELLHLRGEAL